VTTLAIHPRPFRSRLHLAAFGVPLLIVTLFSGLWIAGNNPFPYLFGDDLVPSYMAGTFVREGHSEKLMDFDAAKRFQADLRRHNGLEQHGRTGPWLNPPFFALLFVPLSALPYRAALWTWFGLNLAMLGASIWLLYRMLPADRRRKSDGAIIAGLLIASMPSLQAMACQQNTFLSLLVLSTAVTLWRADRFMLAGAVAGLLAFKPQLALIVWAAMGLLCGVRALVGIATTAGTLGLITLLFLPGTLTDYIQHLSGALPYADATRPYAWSRQVTLQGFARVLLPADAAESAWLAKAIWLALLALLATWLARAIIRLAKTSSLPTLARDRAIALTILAMPLLMPYYMDYDLLLLAIPITLLAAERMNGEAARRTLTWNWAVFYACTFFNTSIADATRISLSVVLLCGLVIQYLLPLGSRRSKLESIASDNSPLIPLAAA
jgi:hypothetical protein